MGKDIIRFHCVIWPAMLLAAGLPLPERVFAHGFLLTKGEKMSKSKGNAMAPADLVAKFGVDGYRYYFLRDVQFGTDGSISLEGMVQRFNSDLANDWGNLCSRLFNMVGKYCDGVVPDPAASPIETEDDDELKNIARATISWLTRRAWSGSTTPGALEAAWELVKRTNRYIEDSAPWNLAKSEETVGRLHAVLYNALEAVRIAALFTAPVMPRYLGRGLDASRSGRHLRHHRHRAASAPGAGCRWEALSSRVRRCSSASSKTPSSGRMCPPRHPRPNAPLFADSKGREVAPPDFGAAPIADTHAHLDMLEDPAAALARAALAGVSFVATVADPSEDASRTYESLDGWLAQRAAR